MVSRRLSGAPCSFDVQAVTLSTLDTMHTRSVHPWKHEHTFGQDLARPGERRTLIVIALTATMMIVEVCAGLVYGSMALLADGLHMASHAVAIGITAVAYAYARRHAADSRFSFGTGKVNSLAGFTGAVLLAVFALFMATESVQRLVHPVSIAFNEAIAVAIVGLLVNGFCGFLLHGGHDHHDHNLRSAYLHVLADALTSALAIFALLSAKFFSLVWMDPLMGIVGAILVTRWSVGLLKQSSRVLLDHQAPSSLRTAIREAIEASADNRVADLHVWSIGPGVYAAIVGVVTDAPRSAAAYKELLPAGLGVAHLSVEVHHCSEPPVAPAPT
jgi:cation diffusion facilitator family transporter